MRTLVTAGHVARQRVQALIVQNAEAYDEGLGPPWATRRAFWSDRASNEAKLRETFLSPDATRLRHVGTSPNVDRYNPDLWTDELAFLSQPGQDRIQLDLFYDYRTNVASYPRWQEYLRSQRPPTLVVWGKYDPSFTVAGATAYKRDVPDAEVHLLEAGHFALDEAADEIAARMEAFLSAHGIGTIDATDADVDLRQPQGRHAPDAGRTERSHRSAAQGLGLAGR